MYQQTHLPPSPPPRPQCIKNVYFTKLAPVTVNNAYMAYVYWSKQTTTRGLRHITMCENAIKESVHDKIVHTKYTQGETNLADIFTKKHKYNQHFLTIHDHISPEKLAHDEITVI